MGIKSMNWDSDFIEDINRRRKRERELAPEMATREDSLLKLMSRSLYGEKVHYALELIQNAEDANSSSITFIFENERVIVINDGDAFTPDEVDAICSVKPGRKKNKIGFFGVGFKSVFNITNIPQVISADFNFNIENYIYPRPSDEIHGEAKAYFSLERGSIFVLPHSQGFPTSSELIENFRREIDDKILLFLDKLKALHFIDKVNDESWSIEKPSTDDLLIPDADDSLILLRDGRTNQTTKWRVFHKDLPVSEEEVSIPEGKEGITDTRILVAFPCDEITKEANKGSTVYCYLPTSKRSDMPFLVQADFVPTVGRGSIQEVDWNKWLLHELGVLAAEAVEQIKDDHYLGKKLYSFIPLKDEVQESLMDILSDAMYQELKSKKIARAMSLDWKRPVECAIAPSPEITAIIFQQDLKCVFGEPLFYVDVELSERARHVLTDLDSSVLKDAEFVEFLAKEDLITGRKPEWFLKVYAYLGRMFDVKDQYHDGSFKWDEEKLQLFSKLEQTKFILTNKGNLTPLKDPNRPDRLICYPQNISLSEVNELLTEGELVFLNKYFQLSTIAKRKEPDPDEEENRKKAREFFNGVGVRIYFKQSHIIKDVILPKYSSGKYEEYDDLKLYNLINYIRLYWSTLESEVKNKKLSEEIFDEIRRTVLLKAYKKKNGEKVSEYMSPGNIYFPKRYGKTEMMEDLFEGVDGIYFLHPYYLNREKRAQRKKKRGRQKVEHGWKMFAEISGVWSSPRVEKNNNWVSISGKDGYEWVEKEYSPSGLHEISGDSLSADVQKLIEYHSGLKDTETIRLKMTVLTQSFSDNWKKYKDYCKSIYKYKYHNEVPKDVHSSSFLNYLKNAKWIPTVNGGFCKPEEAFVYNGKNRFLLGDTVEFVSLPGNQTFLKDIGVHVEPSMEQVIEHLKDYKKAVIEKKEGLEKFKEIYSFIAEKIEEEELYKNEPIKKVKKEFDENELLYMPRKDRSWWKPCLVFWRDCSKTFGPLRGYIEHQEKEIYPSDIKSFLFSLGVRERPSIEQALGVLEDLRNRGDVGAIKKIVTKVYSYINDLISHDHAEQVDWQKYHFLTKNESFSHPNDAFFEDDEEYAKEFHGKVGFISLPFSS